MKKFEILIGGLTNYGYGDYYLDSSFDTLEEAREEFENVKIRKSTYQGWTSGIDVVDIHLEENDYDSVGNWIDGYILAGHSVCLEEVN